ncbi:MAG: DUF2868 domain-containing protein [Desulfosalsimonas sp.]
MTKNWRIKDVIDFHYFLDRDKSGNEAVLNRKIYLEYAESHPEPLNRRDVFKYWLKHLRKKAGESGNADPLPGDIYTEASAAAGLILCAAALISGAGLSWSVLSYSGDTPVNVFTCLWVLLVPQILLLLVLALSFPLRRLKRKPAGINGIYSLIAALVLRISRRAMNYAASKAPRNKQNSFHSALGTACQTRGLYGGLFFWPVFNKAQAAGVAFNTGILAALLIRVTITDVAFGWQSTLQPDPETVYAIVKIIAAPWAWFTEPPLAHPAASQIAGSRMILKEGIYNLATGDLVSWWPFLCLSTAFYGLMPRAVLLILGLWRQKKILAGLNFTHAAGERLWRQMTAPRVKTASRPYKRTAETKTIEAWTENAESEAPPGTGLMSAIVAVPEDIESRGPELAELLKTRLGLVASGVAAVTGDPETDGQNMASLQGRQGPEPARLVIIQESWQPPIKENLAWLRHLKQAAGPDVPAVVCLVGRPDSSGGVAEPVPRDEQILWHQAVNSLGDPYIRVETLGEQSSNEG